MDRCLLLEIDKNKKIVKHWTMEWENKIYIQTNLQITWEGSTYVRYKIKMGRILHVKMLMGQNTKFRKNATSTDIQIALQTGV